MIDRRAESLDSLRRIADTLGIPVGQLFQGAEPYHFWAARECVRFWYSIRTDADRDAALDALRKVLDDEGA